MLNRVFTLRVELAMLLREHQHRHADCFENSEFTLVLAYMFDIFDAPNNLNQAMQGWSQHYRSGRTSEDFKKK